MTLQDKLGTGFGSALKFIPLDERPQLGEQPVVRRGEQAGPAVVEPRAAAPGLLDQEAAPGLVPLLEAALQGGVESDQRRPQPGSSKAETARRMSR